MEYALLISSSVATIVVVFLKRYPSLDPVPMLGNFFGMPTGVIREAQGVIAYRKALALKPCGCCDELVRINDSVCPSCKLEISLGRRG